MQSRSILTLSSIIASAGLLAACGGVTEAEPEEEEEVEEIVLADPCPDQVLDMRGTNETLTCSCDAETAAEGSVWGTGPYSDDSRVCRAAMHAGLIDDEPVNVTINILPGRTSYTASTANGVESRRWGRWNGSFAFEGQTMGEPTEVEEEVAALAACPRNASAQRGTGATTDCSCTAEAAGTGTVWGVGPYTDDSSICRAAVHAGVIAADGGNISYTVSEGLESYEAGSANGVDARRYGRWSGSFNVEAVGDEDKDG